MQPIAALLTYCELRTRSDRSDRSVLAPLPPRLNELGALRKELEPEAVASAFAESGVVLACLMDCEPAGSGCSREIGRVAISGRGCFGGGGLADCAPPGVVGNDDTWA